MRAAVVVLSFLCVSLSAIDLNLPLSASQNAANELVLIHKSTSDTAIQPALSQPGLETGVTYLYSLSELPYYFFHSSYQYKQVGFYLGNSHLAHGLYLENMTYLAANYRYKSISFGLQTRYLFNRVTDYHTLKKFLYDFGLAYSFEQYQLAFAVKNITQTSYFNMDMPVFFLWEANYRIHDSANISVGIEKQSHFDFIYRIASFYEIIPFFSLIASYQYEPQRVGVGAIVSYENWDVIYSIRTHQHLDITHFLSIGYALSP